MFEVSSWLLPYCSPDRQERHKRRTDRVSLYQAFDDVPKLVHTILVLPLDSLGPYLYGLDPLSRLLAEAAGTKGKWRAIDASNAEYVAVTAGAAHGRHNFGLGAVELQVFSSL